MSEEKPCQHDIADRETAVADGYCPQCLSDSLNAEREARMRAEESLEHWMGSAKQHSESATNWHGKFKESESALTAATKKADEMAAQVRDARAKVKNLEEELKMYKIVKEVTEQND